MATISKRELFSGGLGLGIGLLTGSLIKKVIGETPKINAFSPAKLKLQNGEDVIILVNGDSTSYPRFGPYYKLAIMIGSIYDCSVVVHLWGEWLNGKYEGPKQYLPGEIIRIGNGPTLTLYLAALPGGVAGQMFDASRRAAFEAIPKPDLIIMHHGHNMQSFEMPEGLLSVGVGTFLGPIGLTSMKWPNVAQAITTQNPWRDDDNYSKVREAILATGRAHRNLTVLDTYTAFVKRRGEAGLYRDNIHPTVASEADSKGAALTAQTLFDIWLDSDPGSFTTPGWPFMPSENLIRNSDFGYWEEAAPRGFILENRAVAQRDVSIKVDGFRYSLALFHNGDPKARLVTHVTDSALRAVMGKTVSVAILCRIPSSYRRRFSAMFVSNINGQAIALPLASLKGCYDDWMWMVANDIPVTEHATSANTYFMVYPSLDQAESTNDPIHVQKFVMNAGSLPRGGLSY